MCKWWQEDLLETLSGCLPSLSADHQRQTIKRGRIQKVLDSPNAKTEQMWFSVSWRTPSMSMRLLKRPTFSHEPRRVITWQWSNSTGLQLWQKCQLVCVTPWCMRRIPLQSHISKFRQRRTWPFSCMIPNFSYWHTETSFYLFWGLKLKSGKGSKLLQPTSEGWTDHRNLTATQIQTTTSENVFA